MKYYTFHALTVRTKMLLGFLDLVLHNTSPYSWKLVA
jgi:hypothetical protein